MNQKAKKGQLAFYLLVTLLHKETTGINIQVWLVLENKLTHQKEAKYRKMQTEVFDIWNDYTYGHKSASQLLKACSRLVHIPIKW